MAVAAAATRRVFTPLTAESLPPDSTRSVNAGPSTCHCARTGPGAAAVRSDDERLRRREQLRIVRRRTGQDRVTGAHRLSQDAAVVGAGPPMRCRRGASCRAMLRRQGRRRTTSSPRSRRPRRGRWHRSRAVVGSLARGLRQLLGLDRAARGDEGRQRDVQRGRRRACAGTRTGSRTAERDRVDEYGAGLHRLELAEEVRQRLDRSADLRGDRQREDLRSARRRRAPGCCSPRSSGPVRWCSTTTTPRPPPTRVGSPTARVVTSTSVALPSDWRVRRKFGRSLGGGQRELRLLERRAVRRQLAVLRVERVDADLQRVVLRLRPRSTCPSTSEVVERCGPMKKK